MGQRGLSSVMGIMLKQGHWDAMRAHVNACAPLEGCGLLAGKNNAAEKVFLIANQAQSPVMFRMDPAEQLDAFNQIEFNGLGLLAIFHSHPTGPEMPSTTDIAEATYPVVNIIWSRPKGQWQARGFWIENETLTEVKLKITDGE
ncbi:MAG TPA: M67 family metallopeptidase [Anaerolineales bacterium]|nr:M67 family metallopeptidase [Anaerolineales bacterium]